MQVPILTYHAVNVAGNDYASNDHIAFAVDLDVIHGAGLRIVPLRQVVDNLLGLASDDLTNCVALSCDDGTDFDYFDLDFPPHGIQRSFFNSLRNFRRRHGPSAQPDLHLTCFVIADPAARGQMDQSCLAGQDRIRETWWRAALRSNLIAIENHSWDHNHPCLPAPGADALPRGDFHVVDNDARAQYEIVQAQEYLLPRLAPHRPSLFCYPFGHVNDFLRTQWLPEHAPGIGIDAAFGDGATPVEMHSDRWNLPRYVCGWHWKSPEQLAEILAIPRD
ncbi:MAG: polysaccharide deacetylase family protein [Tahibacter sp.]